MKIIELQKCVIIQDWLNTLSSRATIDAYLLGLQIYTEWINKTPEELIDESESEATLLMRKRHIKSYLINFKAFLTEKKLAPLSIKSYLTGVKAFYRFYDVELPNLPKNKNVTLQENNGIPNKNDIQDALKVCDPLEKAILLVGASSGLSINEIIRLRIKDFKNGYDTKTEITTLKLRRLKTDIDFVTFLTPEASRAVIEYLAYRERSVKTSEVKRQNQLAKQQITSEDNYLFCMRRIPDAYLTSKDDEVRKFTDNALMGIYRDISEKARKNTKKGNYNVIRSHNMRKFFNSALLNAGCDFFHVEYFMGHTLPSTQEHYFRASPEKLKEIYKKYIPYLTIQKELDVSESQEYQAIKSENDILRAETARHVVERTELAELQSQLKDLQSDQKAFKNTITLLAMGNPRNSKDVILDFIKDYDAENKSKNKIQNNKI